MKQITLLTRKDHAELLHVVTLMSDAGINIEDIDADTVEETGVIVLSVDRYDDALRVFANHNIHAITQETLVIRIEDKPGALATIARKLRDCDIDVRSMHILRRDVNESLVSLVISDFAKARIVLADVLVS